MTSYSFTVDAELLRELGARLVGRPHIALAELIKNSYDADATSVDISFFDESITVSDNGHGMSEEDFVGRWMRLGTTQKRIDRKSPRFKRPLTGSKGVGRLAVQLLADKTTITSVGKVDQSSATDSRFHDGILAAIDWKSAQSTRDLASVAVQVTPSTPNPEFPGASGSGTIVTLSELTEVWDRERFENVAQEIWALRPPFRDSSGTGMTVTLTSDQSDIEESFNRQMGAILDIWNARVIGRLLPQEVTPENIHGVLPSRLPSSRIEDDSSLDSELTSTYEGPDRFLEITVELRDHEPRTVVYVVPNCPIDELAYEIRIFNMERRQPKGIKVSDARNYLRKFGGVGIYDTGFKLPYYGADQDWLNSERDYGRRLARSDLVPDELQVKNGLLDLPSNTRLFGWVRISTGHEEAVRRKQNLSLRDTLGIQVTRDRLTDNAAYQQLRVLVRTAVDMYAMETARQKSLSLTETSTRTAVKTADSLKLLGRKLETVRGELSTASFGELKAAVDVAEKSAKLSEQQAQSYAALLGALATAGSTSLAYEHEISKQVNAVRDVVVDLEVVAPELRGRPADVVHSTIERLRDWIDRTGGIRAVFGALLSQESRQRIESYNARRTIQKISLDIAPLARGIEVDVSGIPKDLALPSATLPAWSSIFQNLLINSYNALQGSNEPKIHVVGGASARYGWVTVLDSGVGVDLLDADELWRPFERRLQLPPEQEAAGLGGMGLGLTIVRMIADQIAVEVSFVAPPAGMSTAVKIRWKKQ